MTDENNISLDELKNGSIPNKQEIPQSSNTDNYVPVNVADITKPAEKPVLQDSYFDEIMQKANEVSQQKFEQAKKIVEDNIVETQMNKINEEGTENIHRVEPIEVLSKPVIDENSEPISFKITEDDEEDENPLMSEEERTNLVRTAIKEKIKPITSAIDLSTFKVAEKPKSFFQVLKGDIIPDYIADYPLINSGFPISMREFKAFDIEKLNPRNSGRNEFNTYMDIYRLIYSHITNEGKPPLEEFLKMVRYSDNKHMYFSIYKSSFNKNNNIPYSCIKKGCEHVFMEDITMNDMVKFPNDIVKDRFYKILNKTDSQFKIEGIENVMAQISDKYVVELRDPSIFNIIFETSVLAESFRTKNSEMIGYISYIANIYEIDRTNNQLIPIELKVDPKDLQKTIMYKISAFSAILDTLDSDQYYLLSSMIGKISKEDDQIKYVLPEKKCPKCGTTIPETEDDPVNLLFTRHRLGALATT